ncbi:hypothetical protein QBC41DRAFT_313682 [Cercophora samala]|uniref:Protein kinase domain-containing protein n=1 Tax=Cercophora samala TaxID=330535 RepID=A0AA40DFI0_9PEZI|nr:hypothetical protein QBC41DRAFT_313682 [Cercophora samala]
MASPQTMSSPPTSPPPDDSGLSGLQGSTPVPFGETVQIRGWKNMTLAVYPLEYPEIAARQAYRKESPATNESYLWFNSHGQGFVLVRWFVDPHSVPSDGMMVGLFYSVDRPEEQVVIKQVLGNPFWRYSSNSNGTIAEIEYMTLDDPAAHRVLKFDPILYPIAEMYAVQIHHVGSRPANDIKNWHGDARSTLYMKYYNGGTLWGLMNGHCQGRVLESSARGPGEDVPEEFIWHFIAQVGRAYAYLHTGHVKSPQENLANNNHLKPDLEHPKLEDWVAIGHNDGHASNLWLHYPTAEEKKKNSKLEAFNDCFPQIHLCDFGMAHDLDHDAQGDYRQDIADLPEPGTWFDKMLFGSMIKFLLTAFTDELPELPDCRELVFHVAELEDQEKNITDGIKWTKLATCDIMKQKYSKELLDIVGKFEDMMDFASEQYKTKKDMEDSVCPWVTAFSESDSLAPTRRWEKWPSNNWLYGSVIAMADYKLDQHRKRQKRKHRSVLWTKGINSTMPYRAFEPQRWPFTGTQDFQQAHMALVAVRMHTLPFWPSGSVDVKMMNARGGMYYDLVRTIYRTNKVLYGRRQLEGLSSKRYKYPALDRFVVRPASGALDHPDKPETSSSSPSSSRKQSPSQQQSPSLQQTPSQNQPSPPKIGNSSSPREAMIRSLVNKPVRELFNHMSKQFMKIDNWLAQRVDLVKRGTFSTPGRNAGDNLEQMIKDFQAEKDSLWMEVDRRKSKQLQEQKAQEVTAHPDRKQRIVRRVANQLDNETRFLTSLIKWWKDQMAWIDNQLDGSSVPERRDATSKPDLFEAWTQAAESGDENSISFEDQSTILPEEDEKYQDRADARLKAFCDHVLRVGFLEDPDMSLKDITNLPGFWAADDTVLPEADYDPQERFSEEKSIKADAELVKILREFFNKPGSLDDMDRTIRSFLDAAEKESTIIEASPGVRRSTPAPKQIPLAEYYRKLYAGENPWATEDEAGDGTYPDDDEPPAMAKSSTVTTVQVWPESPDDSVRTLSRNLGITLDQGKLVAERLAGSYLGTVVSEQLPQRFHTTTTNHDHSAPVLFPEELRRGPRPWDTLEDFMQSGMGSFLLPHHSPSRAFGVRRYMKARSLRWEGDITVDQYWANGMERAIQHAIQVEEEIENGAFGNEGEFGGTGASGSKREHRFSTAGSRAKRRRVV